MEVAENFVPTDIFADYIDWRADHPSDDIMTELLQAEFEDETGTVRRLTREELLTYINVITGAGNETTGRLIGWTGKVLAEHPDQRRELVEDPSLIPNAIEELLRFEPPAPHAARFVAQDVEIHGRTVPEGSILMLLPASANHDDRRFPDGDLFDIHRQDGKPPDLRLRHPLLPGPALARLEGRVALEEVLKRFPTWEVDMDRARLPPPRRSGAGRPSRRSPRDRRSRAPRGRPSWPDGMDTSPPDSQPAGSTSEARPEPPTTARSRRQRAARPGSGSSTPAPNSSTAPRCGTGRS